MTRDELKQAHDLSDEINKLSQLIDRYSTAEKIEVAIPNVAMGRTITSAPVTCTQAEIGAAVVSALRQRLADANEKLAEYGVN